MNFKSLREDKLKLTKEQFAQIYSVSVGQVEEWDTNNEPKLKILQEIASNSGLDFNAIVGYEKPKVQQLSIDDTWKNADFTKKTIIEYIKDNLEKNGISIEEQEKYIFSLRNGVEASLIKPMVSIVGRSDTGKSTLINSLLGQEKMPASWTPTTSIAVYIKHINDRPSFIKSDVWIFSNSYGDEKLWNSKKLNDEEYCTQWKIAEGDIDILKDYGTRQGESHYNAGSAIVFVDAPILLNCDILDLPGFGTERESDDMITFGAAQKTDVLVYLSQATGFMRQEDIEYLKANIRNIPVWENKENNLKPLSNLFVVASQSHNVNNGNREELGNILKSGWERFCSTLSSEYWTNREQKSGISNYQMELAKRFFTYTTDIPVLCKQLNFELKTILEQLPNIINQNTKAFVREYVEARKPSLSAELKKYEELTEQREKYVQLLSEIDKNELKRTEDNDNQKEKIRDVIDEFAKKTSDEFSDYYSRILNVDAIMDRIKKEKVKNKKDDIQAFASKIQDEMQGNADRILRSHSEKLSSEIQNYIESFSASIKLAFDSAKVSVDFDAGYAFASALAKIGIIGGLGAWVTGFATFLFATSGIFIGGSLFLGALGPIGLAIGLVIAASLGIIKLFGGGWEKSVAKKLVKEYEKQEVLEKFRNAIGDYWKQTKEAFNQAASILDKKWQKYVDNLRETVRNYNLENIQNKIIELKNIESFFDHIPL